MLEELPWKAQHAPLWGGGQADIKTEVTWDSTLPIDWLSFVKMIGDFTPQIDHQSPCVLNELIKGMSQIYCQMTK